MARNVGNARRQKGEKLEDREDKLACILEAEVVQKMALLSLTLSRARQVSW